MRAPFIIHRNGGGNIRIDLPVVVESETIDFFFSGVYSGKLADVHHTEYSAKVRAVYNLSFDSDVTCSMNFFSPSADAVSVKVNDEDCAFEIKNEKSEGNGEQGAAATGESGSQTDPEAAPDNRQANAVYTILFNASIKSGKNTVAVEYTQPLGKREFGYGYFSKGKWSTDAEYIFGPIETWKRAADFKAVITVHIPYKGEIADLFFGPAFNITMRTGMVIGNQYAEISGSKSVNSTAGDEKYLSRTFEIGKEIPEMIFINVLEK